MSPHQQDAQRCLIPICETCEYVNLISVEELCEYDQGSKDKDIFLDYTSEHNLIMDYILQKKKH